MISAEPQLLARTEGLDKHSCRRVPDPAASHISQEEAPPREGLCSSPAAVTAPSARAIPSVDSTGLVVAAVVAGHYSVLLAVRPARGRGSQRGIGSGRDVVGAIRAEAFGPRTRMSVCGRGNDAFFGRPSGDGGGGGVRVPLLLLRGAHVLLCAWSVRGGGSLLLRVRGRRR